MRLGVNIDHVATLRQARKDVYPNLLDAARDVFNSGGDGITVHLREDRRHIQEEDVFQLRKQFPRKHLNLEMAVDEKITKIALKLRPNSVCLVPEKRQELTTEGGLDVAGMLSKITRLTKQLQQKDILVSLFINAELKQIEFAQKTGADAVELHTGSFGEVSDKCRKSFNLSRTQQELKKIIEAALYAKSLGLIVNAGHGLTYDNVRHIAKHPELFSELNIGHNIIARAVFVGLKQAVSEMRSLLA